MASLPPSLRVGHARPMRPLPPWLILASLDAALLAALGVLLGWPILYALAPLSYPAWAWLDSTPQGKAWLDRWRR